jgi:hypothetical protein
VLSWIVRLGVVKSLSPYAERLLKLSFLFDPLGSDKSGFHMFLKGIGKDGKPAEIRIFMIARQVHGPNIPCIPAILLARRLAAGQRIEAGARPCLDFVTLDEIMHAIATLDIDTFAVGPRVDERWLGRATNG